MMRNDDFGNTQSMMDQFNHFFHYLVTKNQKKAPDREALVAKIKSYIPPTGNEQDKAFHFFTYWMIDETETPVERAFKMMGDNKDIEYKATTQQTISDKTLTPNTPDQDAQLQNIQGSTKDIKANDAVMVRVTDRLWFDARVLSIPPGTTTDYEVQFTNREKSYAGFKVQYTVDHLIAISDEEKDIRVNNIVAVKTGVTNNWGKNIRLEAKVLSVSADKCTVMYISPWLAFHSMIPIIRANVDAKTDEDNTMKHFKDFGDYIQVELQNLSSQQNPTPEITYYTELLTNINTTIPTQSKVSKLNDITPILDAIEKILPSVVSKKDVIFIEAKTA
jgi:hypothetical protein